MTTKKMEANDSGFPRSIGAPATRALHGAGFTTLTTLTKATTAELIALHRFGPKALRILQAALEVQGLTLATPDVEKQPQWRQKCDALALQNQLPKSTLTYLRLSVNIPLTPGVSPSQS